MTTRFADIHARLAIHRSMEVRREEYLDHMTFRANIRPLFTEIFGPLIGLREEWQQQGASLEELAFQAFRYRRPMWTSLPVNCGWDTPADELVLEETDEYIIARDYYGRTVKLITSSATLPLPLDHPVRNMDDWLRIKHHYEYSVSRLGANWIPIAKQALDAGHVVSVSIPGGFDEPRQLMGEEALCIAFYEQPELIHDMLATIGQTAQRVLDQVSSVVTIDQLDVHEDFAGKSGPLIGPNLIQQFIKPYYCRIWDMLCDRGAQLFSIDTDGNINSVIAALLDAGINVMLPMEPAAGVDIVSVRQKHGKQLAFVGGIDKHVLRRTPGEIEVELEYKLPHMIASGGCLLGLDHRIPNGTPLANYRFYISKVWEILERESHNL